jgi:hypothetical protein
VRYKLALDAYLREKNYPWKALVAFSGTVRDGGKDYTEPNMNGFSESRPPRFLSGLNIASLSSPISFRLDLISHCFTQCMWTRSSAGSTPSRLFRG